jgi:hypothetical protein
MFHFNKNNPLVQYGDTRQESYILCDGRTLNIAPDTVLDFRALPYENESFHLVVFDPPHLVRAGKRSWLSKKYGVLGKRWEADIEQGFAECWRVLAPKSTLIFKWNETQIPLSKLRPLFPAEPVFGHTTTQNLKTHWVVFFKIG